MDSLIPMDVEHFTNCEVFKLIVQSRGQIQKEMLAKIESAAFIHMFKKQACLNV